MDPVVVTGGAGYVGSHTVLALARAGRRVVVVDDLSAGHPEAVQAIGADAGVLAAGGSVDLAVLRVHDAAALTDLLRRHAAHTVLHFAAWLDVGESVRDPLAYYRNNVTGTLAVLDAMGRAAARHFVFSSTCAIFGEPEVVPIDEDHPKRPVNAYGETKLAIERALPHVERAHGVRWIALRYFNAAGADPDGRLGEDHEPEIHLVPRAIEAASGGAPLRIFGEDYPTPDGTCLRDYVHVADLADAHVRAVAALEAGAASTAYNLGTGRPHSVREVIDTVGRVVGRPVPATPAPRRPGDPARLYASSERVGRELGWRPRFVDLAAIVDTAWRWHAAHPRGYGSGRS